MLITEFELMYQNSRSFIHFLIFTMQIFPTSQKIMIQYI